MKVSINDIEVGERRREEYGDIDSLAASIARFGLLQPVVLDEADNLVAGGRRLTAVKSLGWSEVEIRRAGDLTQSELREIELEENLRRKDLTPYERSKQMVEYAEAAKQVSEEQAETCSTVEQVSKPKRGPERKEGSYRDIQGRTGLSAPTLHRAEQHVSAVDRYPELKPFSQTDARKIARNLDKLPEPEREERRASLKRNDPDALADLTNRPRLPKGPTPKEIADNDPGVQWSKTVQKIYSLVNGVRDSGGIVALTQKWRPESKRYYLKEVRRLKAALSSWEEILEAEVDDE